MLVVIIQNEFINETLSLVNEKKILKEWSKFSFCKVHCT